MSATSEPTVNQKDDVSIKAKEETLYDACRRGDISRLQEYVQNKGCVTERDRNFMTMLHHSAHGGQLAIVKLITGTGQADVDAADEGGWTPLHYAVDRGHEDIVKVLLDDGANINAKDEAKRTPLHLAVLSKNVAMTQLLLKSGAGKNVKNVTGKTAAMLAVDIGDQELIALFPSSATA